MKIKKILLGLALATSTGLFMDETCFAAPNTNIMTSVNWSYIFSDRKQISQEELNQVFEEEKSKYEALSNKDKWKNGVLGFYLENDDKEAVYALTRADDKEGSYLSARQRNSSDDAASMDNMKQAIENIAMVEAKRQNDRGIDGAHLDTLGITSFMMAVGQGNANYSAGTPDHATVFNTSENLAWNNQKQAARSIEQWWDEEKQVYDYLRSQGYQTESEMSAYLSKKENIDALSKKFRSVGGYTPSTVGHYTNMVDSVNQDKTAGYGVRKGENHYYAHSLVLSSGVVGKYYTIDEYRNLFDNYYDRMKKDLGVTDEKYKNSVINLRKAVENNKKIVAYAENYMANNYMPEETKEKLTKLVGKQKNILERIEVILVKLEAKISN